MVILNFLKHKDYYAYELNKILIELFEINESTAYAILKKMKDKELVTYYLQESSDGPIRKYYKITNFGIEQLESSKKSWFEFTKKVNDNLK